VTETGATALVGLLLASYPRERLDPEHVAAYRGFLLELRSDEGARAAVMSLIRTEDRLPSIARIRRAYATWQAAHGADRALPEPDLTPEQRRENLTWIRRLAERITRPVSQDG
jgi:hypothetical protein